MGSWGVLVVVGGLGSCRERSSLVQILTEMLRGKRLYLRIGKMFPGKISLLEWILSLKVLITTCWMLVLVTTVF